jgi:menaquinone-9 beta-reductase
MGLALADPHTESLSANGTYDVIIAGGGLGGLTSAILLGRAGVRTLLLEKKSYPSHKVCGEYISNEARPFLQSVGIDPRALDASAITKLRVSSPSGKNLYASLGLGGFGISRYTLDHELYSIAKQYAEVKVNTRVKDICFCEDKFDVTLHDGKVLSAKLVIGSYGKRDTLDKVLERPFMQRRTGYMAVKYHIRTDYPVDEIGLDNFRDGYCGIVKVDGDRYCLCYLTKRSNMLESEGIGDMEMRVLFRNPVLKDIFKSSHFLYAKPEVINEISFARKEAVKDHVWMVGDTAGLITPLCGNGMSMALHAAKLACGHILALDLPRKPGISLHERNTAELRYVSDWKKTFSSRLFAGRQIQGLFGNTITTTAALGIMQMLPPLKKWLIRKTHGQYF